MLVSRRSIGEPHPSDICLVRLPLDQCIFLPKPSCHTGDGTGQLGGFDGFGHMGVISGGEGLVAITWTGICRHGNGGQPSFPLFALARAHSLDQRVAVLARHSQISKQNVRSALADGLNGFMRRRHAARDGPARLEEERQKFPNVFLVVHDQHVNR